MNSAPQRARRKDRSGIKHGGWKFESVLSPICDSNQLFRLGGQLSNPYSDTCEAVPFCVHGATRSLKPCTCGSALVMGVRMHMPESVFGDSVIRITHRSGKSLSFTALDALRSWARNSIEHGSRSLRTPPGMLPQWKQRLSAARAESTIDFDWTFCCDDFVGKWSSSDDDNQTAGVSEGQMVNSSGPSHVKKLTPTGPTGMRWSEHMGAGLSVEGPAGQLLRQRGNLLWEADVLLFADFLHDHGKSELRVRVRVMDSCFLVLLTHELVIQGVLSQQREVRFFHRFGEKHVLREQTFSREPIRRGDVVATALPLPRAISEEMHLDAPAVAIPPRVSQAVPLRAPSLRLALPSTDAVVTATRMALDGVFLVVGLSDGALVVLQLKGVSSPLAPAVTCPRVRSRLAPAPAAVTCPRTNRNCAHRAAITSLQMFSSESASPHAWVSSSEDGTCALWNWDEPAIICVQRWSLDSCDADRVTTDLAGNEGDKSRRLTPIIPHAVCEPNDGGSDLRFAAACGSTITLMRVKQHETQQLHAHGVVTALQMVTAHRYLCAAAFGGVSLWHEFGRGAALALLRFYGSLDSMCISPDERYIACGALDNTLVLWPVPAQDGHSKIACATDDATDTFNGAEVKEDIAAASSGAALFFGGHAQKVVPVGFDPSGGWCASAGGTQPVLWKLDGPGMPTPVRNNELATTLHGHTSSVMSIQFAPSASHTALATADCKGVVNLYDSLPSLSLGSGPPGRVMQPTARCQDVVAESEDSLVWGCGESAGWLFVVGAAEVACYQCTRS